MNYGKIIYYDTANARGLSTVLFVSGCTNNCKGCHNLEAQDFNYGKPFTKEVEDKIIQSLKNSHVKNLVISGGDPLHPNNIEAVTNFCERVKIETCFDAKIIVYTGYLMENLWADQKYKKLFALIDKLIDGPYIKELATKQLDYRGSRNQRCWNLFTTENCLRVKADISEWYFKEKTIGEI